MPNVCNNWTGSKLLINFKHPIVERFKASLQAHGHALSRTVCEGSSSSQRPQNDEFSNLSQVRPIGEFKNLIQNTYCLLLGQQTSLILISLAGIMRAVPNVQSLQGQMVLAINAHVERMLKFH